MTRHWLARRAARVIGERSSLGGLLAVALACLSACNGDKRPPVAESPRPSTAAQDPSREQTPADLRIVAMADLSGYLEPCGCQSRPLGGIDKAAAALRALDADGVPRALVHSGSLFFEAGGGAAHKHADAIAAEVAAEANMRASTLADALSAIGMLASAAGKADLEADDKRRAELVERAKLALLGAPGGPSHLLLERGAVKLGVFAVADPHAGGAPALEPEQAVTEAQAHVRALREQGASVVVGLVQAELRTARKIAGGIEGVDFVLAGGTDRAELPAPERIGGATLLRAAHRGHALVVIDVFVRDRSAASARAPLADVSRWTRDAQAEAKRARIADLEQRIVEWRKSEGVDPKLLAEQESRLASLKQELSALGASGAASGPRFSARVIELPPEVKPDPELRALLEAHDKRLNDHNQVALAHMKPLPVPRGEPTYVGSERCGECHDRALAWWKDHAHGNAYETLVERNKQFSLSCVSCHVTGYGKPGGATVVHNQGLVDVGCESCHGPASLHVEDRDTDEDKNVIADTPESVCVECHNPEHSDKFVYATYKEKLRVPGHGLPAGPAGVSP